MKSSWHELWGCARGPVRRLSPQGRLICGIICFALCMVAPVHGLPGIGLVIAVVLFWLGLCRLPGRVLLANLSFGLLLFLPYFPTASEYGWIS